MADLQVILRKRNYNLNKSKEVLNKLGKKCKIDKQFDCGSCSDASNNNKTNSNSEPNETLDNTTDAGIEVAAKPIGYSPDFDMIKLRKNEMKRIDFSNKLFLSPLTTVGNLPFRRICKEFGADITCGMYYGYHFICNLMYSKFSYQLFYGF